jgi:oligopeptide transport system permease protein
VTIDTDNPAYWYEDLRADVVLDAYLFRNYELMFEEEPMNFTAEEWDRLGAEDHVVGGYDEDVHYIPDSNQYVANVDYFAMLGYEDGTTPYYWMGTTEEGKDLFTLLWIGGRVSLMLGLVISLINISIGIVYGSISGYYGGNVDLTMQRIIEIIGGIPWIVIATLVMMRWGSSLQTTVVAFVLTGWIGNSRMVRAQFYRYKSREYVLASRTLVSNDFRLMWRHILPNAIGTIITASILTIPSFIFSEATLSYLGIISLQETSTVGTLLNAGQKVLTQYPHVLFWPAVFISLLMISFNMFGNGLRDAFNPSLRGSE